MNPQPTTPQPDLQALALAKAIRQQESGGNYKASGDAGTSNGAYQFQQNTWKQFSKQILGSDNAPMTPENQNAVAYGMIKTWKDSGMGPAEIAAKWNSGSEKGWENKVGTTTINGKAIPYNVPQYVSSVVDNFKKLYPEVTQQFGGQPAQQQGGLIPTANAEAPGATPTSSPSVGGFVQNVFSSAGNLASGIGQAIMHPVDTISNIAGTAAGGVEKLAGLQNEDTQKFDALTGYLKQRYGGDSLSEVMNHIGKTAYTDPVGMALDLSTVLDGFGAAVSAVGKTAQVAELSKAAALMKQASELVNPIAQGAKVAGKVADTASNVAKFGASKMIGLSKAEDVTNIINNYDKLSPEARASMSRESLAQDFGKAGDTLNDTMKEGGLAYGDLRQAPGIVHVPQNWIEDVLKKGSSVTEEDGSISKAIPFGLKLEKTVGTDGNIVNKVVADTKSFTRDSRDIAAVQTFVDHWANKTELTNAEFLNMREDLAKLGNLGRDVGKNQGAELIGRALRADANKTMRHQVKSATQSLENVDKNQAPLINEWKQYKKDFLTVSPDGGYEFKPGAINKIANATGKGKGILLQRMEQISPGITKRIELMKTVESIESAYNMKVGTYMKDLVGGAAIIHGNIPTVIAAIVSHPSVAIPLLRGLGWTKAQIAPVLQFLKTYVNSTTLKYPAEAGVVSNATGPQTGQPPQKI
jgi:Transglycosylase-like domain